MGYLKRVINALLNRKPESKENIISQKGMDDRYLMSPTNYLQGVWGTVISMDGNSTEPVSNEIESKPKIKITVKPKDVLSELERIPTLWSCNNLDEKIQMLKDKLEYIQQSYTRSEVEHMIMCLENRKKYMAKDSKGKVYQEFFSKFDITDQEKIDKFLKTHSLVMKEADIFIPELPAEAVEIMKAFCSKTDELCGKKPRLYVIATEDSFKKTYERRDPILLAQSPFGMYFHILGAWDEEMMWLGEL